MSFSLSVFSIHLDREHELVSVHKVQPLDFMALFSRPSASKTARFGGLFSAHGGEQTLNRDIMDRLELVSVHKVGH